MIWTLMLQMEECGHTEQLRGQVAVRVVSRYQQSLANHLREVRRMYRSRKEQQGRIRAAKGKPGKSGWFKMGGATNALRVPATSES